MCGRPGPMPPEVRRRAALLERRWLLSVLYAAYLGAVRFSQFRDVLGPVPPATLAQRLSELEDAGLLERVVVDDRPPRTEYRLTPEGRRLAPLLVALTHCSGRRRRPT